MFGFGIGELIVVVLLAFLLVPVKDVPALIGKISYLLGQLANLRLRLEDYARRFQKQLEQEAEAEQQHDQEQTLPPQNQQNHKEVI